MIYAIAVLGLNILTGYNGQISLGHGGFFAVGAYTAAILMHRYGVPYWATLPPAALICFVLGVLFGLPALRFEGPYLALVTLAMAVATPQLLKYFDNWTGGQQGLNLVKPVAAGGARPQPRPLALFHRAASRCCSPSASQPTCSTAAPAAPWSRSATSRSRRQPWASTPPAIRRSPSAPAPCSPASPARFPRSPSALSRPRASACFCRYRFWWARRSAASATIGGAIVGGIFIEFVPNFANDISDAAPWAIYGVAMLLFMYAMPHGVVG